MARRRYVHTNGEAMRRIREEGAFSRPEVAKAVGMSPKTIERIETKEDYEPKRETLLPLLEFYGVTLEDVLVSDPAPLSHPADAPVGDDERKRGPGASSHRTG